MDQSQKQLFIIPAHVEAGFIVDEQIVCPHREEEEEYDPYADFQ